MTNHLPLSFSHPPIIYDPFQQRTYQSCLQSILTALQEPRRESALAQDGRWDKENIWKYLENVFKHLENIWHRMGGGIYLENILKYLENIWHRMEGGTNKYSFLFCVDS